MYKKIIITVVALVALAVAYWLISPLWRNTVLNEKLPGTVTTLPIKDMPQNEPEVLFKKELIARAHNVSGSALLVKSGNDTFLRFENLKTVNGPDLRIYLSSDLSAEDIVDLGPIKATQGDVNYMIPQGTDLSKYKNVMIWCRAFGVLFSYAEF